MFIWEIPDKVHNMGILKRKIIESLPFGKSTWLLMCILKNIIRTAKPYPTEQELGFFGWDMYTPHCPPWIGESKVSNNFCTAVKELKNLVNSKRFISSPSFVYQVDDYFLKSHMWRTYNIFWSVNFAINSTHVNQKNFVECGVGDGLSIYFAIASSVAENILNHKFYLYDAWHKEEEKNLFDSPCYNLEIENAKSNLKKYEGITIFNQGLIPKSFESSENPNELVWLHIDLGLPQPTLETIQYFYDKLVPGGVILLDHYGWHGHRDSKKMADEFFETKTGINLPLPTGQSIYFKPSGK